MYDTSYCIITMNGNSDIIHETIYPIFDATPVNSDEDSVVDGTICTRLSDKDGF